MDVKQTATVIDTTKRQRAGKIPKWIAEDFQAILSMNADAMVVLDHDGYVLYANPAVESLFNLPSSEIFGAFFGFPIILDEPVALHILRGFKKSVAAEMRMVEVVWAGEMSYLLSFRDLTDRIMAEQALSVARDGLDERVQERTRDLEAANDHLRNEIIERKRAEEALRVSEARYRAIVDSQTELITRFTPDYVLTFANEALLRYSGLKREDLVGHNALEFLTPDQHEEFKNCSATLGKDSPPASIENYTMTPEGELRWQQWVNTAIVDRDGHLVEIQSVGRDITGRKRAEEALRASEERYRAVFEQSGVGMTHVGKDGHFLRVNQKYCKITGYSSEELAAMSIADVTYPPDVAEETLLVKRLIAGEITAFSREKRYVKKDSAIVWVNLTVTPIYKNGTLDYLTGVSEDITERREAEDALRESEEKFRVLAESSSAMFWLYQGERFVYVNGAGERLTGFTVDELLRMRFWDVVHPDDRDIVRDRGLARQRGEPVPGKYEIKLLTRGGETRFVELTAGRIMYRGAPAGVATFFDITERKRAEEALKFERSQLLSIFDSIDEVIYVADPCTYEILYANKATQERFGKCTVGGICYKELQNRDTPCGFCTNPTILNNRGEPYRWEYHNPTVNTDFLIYDRIIKWPDGRDVRFELAIDITGRKRAEEELEKAKARAELYLDLMGHDINNMHQIALGYLELARDMQADADRKEYIDKPIDVLQRSARLIQNVRKLQKLHDDEFQVRSVDVATVLAAVQQEFGTVSNKAIKLELNGCESCSVQANELLHDVFANLVSNAIKHTEGRADIVIKMDVVDDQGRCCRVRIEDNGPGIPDDFKPTIFNRVLKGTKKAKGMGLGLYLVKSLVDSYGGRVMVEDRVAGDHTKGARFVVTLPAVEK